jgi:hypothetical protein
MQVAANALDRSRMVVYEDGRGCPATQCFNAHGTATSKKVKGAPIPNTTSQNIENAFAKTIRRGSDGSTLDCRKPAPFVCSGDDTHGLSLAGESDCRAKAKVLVAAYLSAIE